MKSTYVVDTSNASGLQTFDIPVGQGNMTVNYVDSDFLNATGKKPVKRTAPVQRRSGRLGAVLADSLKRKQDINMELAKSQTQAAKSLGKTSVPAPKLPSIKPEKKGLSTGAKIGIGVGVLAVVGIAAYFIIKRVKK